MQPPYNTWKNLFKSTFLFDLDTDYHELHDLTLTNPDQFKRMSGLLNDFIASVQYSQQNETGCGKHHPSPAPPPGPLPPSRTDCKWANNTGQSAGDFAHRVVQSKEEC